MATDEIVKEFFSQLPELFTGDLIMDEMSDMVYFIKNEQGRYVVANRPLAERCGFADKSELIGKTADQVYRPPLGTSYRAQDDHILQTGEPILNQLELQIYPSQETGWCLTSKVPLFNREGRVIGLVGISKDLHIPSEKGEDYSDLAKVISYIHAHYDQPLKIQDLADMAAMSTYQFEQRIQRIFEITAGQFIQKVRMDTAVQRLKETDDPISRIALDCGYADQSTFSRQFKQTVGLSPALYRKTFRK